MPSIVFGSITNPLALCEVWGCVSLCEHVGDCFAAANSS